MGCVSLCEMHPIKNLLLRTCVLRFSFIAAALLCSAVEAADEKGVNAAAKPVEKTGPQSGSSLGESRELFNARMELQLVLSRVDEKHPDVAVLRARIAMLEKLEPRKINIDFRGGPLSKFVETISNGKGVSFTIVNAGEPADLQIELPPFSLYSCPLRTVTAVVRNLLLPQGLELEPIDPEQNSVVCTLRRISRPEADQTEFTVVQLGKVRSKMSPDEIVATVRSAWELDPSHDPKALLIKFHPGTKMLLVYGPKSAIVVTERVIAALPEPIF